MSSDPTAFRSNQRMKVYAGRRKAQQSGGDVPSLLQICQRFLHEHVDQLEEVGDVPFHLLQSTFEACTTAQLERISLKNPVLEEDLNPIWAKHVKKIFPKEAVNKRESNWKAYRRLCREREEKLQRIANRISQKNSQTAAGVKGTQRSEVINPINMQKKQLRNGLTPTAGIPDAKRLSQSRRAIFNTGSKSELRKLNAEHPIQIAPGLSTSVRVSSGAVGKPGAPKMGALMAKSLKMMRGQRR